ncbi:MAG: hydrolase [Gemmataceae bacterium]|nr:hydrolase [Gemmataceae bacterium]
MLHVPRLNPEDTALLIVDIQEKLIGKIHRAEELVENTLFLLKAAQALSVPIFATEQYPKGLGPTVEALRPFLPACLEKKSFSCLGQGNLGDFLKAEARVKVVLAGIEAHVCVMQTALDLLNRGFQVFLAVDAISSRYVIDYETAIRRMEKAGCVAATVETVAFELLHGADHPSFKTVSVLVQERMKQVELRVHPRQK